MKIWPHAILFVSFGSSNEVTNCRIFFMEAGCGVVDVRFGLQRLGFTFKLNIMGHQFNRENSRKNLGRLVGFVDQLLSGYTRILPKMFEG